MLCQGLPARLHTWEALPEVSCEHESGTITRSFCRRGRESHVGEACVGLHACASAMIRDGMTRWRAVSPCYDQKHPRLCAIREPCPDAGVASNRQRVSAYRERMWGATIQEPRRRQCFVQPRRRPLATHALQSSVTTKLTRDPSPCCVHRLCVDMPSQGMCKAGL